MRMMSSGRCLPIACCHAHRCGGTHTGCAVAAATGNSQRGAATGADAEAAARHGPSGSQDSVDAHGVTHAAGRPACRSQVRRAELQHAAPREIAPHRNRQSLRTRCTFRAFTRQIPSLLLLANLPNLHWWPLHQTKSPETTGLFVAPRNASDFAPFSTRLQSVARAVRATSRASGWY